MEAVIVAQLIFWRKHTNSGLEARVRQGKVVDKVKRSRKCQNFRIRCFHQEFEEKRWFFAKFGNQLQRHYLGPWPARVR